MRNEFVGKHARVGIDLYQVDSFQELAVKDYLLVEVRNTRTNCRYICYHNTPYRVGKSTSRTTLRHDQLQTDNGTYAMSTFSSTKLTLSCLSSRIRTTGSGSDDIVAV